MATTYLSPQQLKDFAQRVEEVAKKFPGEVVRIRHSFSRDWDGDPAIYFRIVFTDEAATPPSRLRELTHRIEDALIKDLALFDVGILCIHSLLRLPNQGRTGQDRKILNGNSGGLAGAGRPSCQSSARRAGASLIRRSISTAYYAAFSSSGSGRGPKLEWFHGGTIWLGTKIRTQDYEGRVQCSVAELLAWMEHSFAGSATRIGGCGASLRRVARSTPTSGLR